MFTVISYLINLIRVILPDNSLNIFIYNICIFCFAVLDEIGLTSPCGTNYK